MTSDRPETPQHQDPSQASGKPRRPGVLRWLWYAMGGGLPARYSPWVLHDTSTRTWAVRHVLRSLVQLAVPIALVLILVPGRSGFAAWPPSVASSWRCSSRWAT